MTYLAVYWLMQFRRKRVRRQQCRLGHAVALSTAAALLIACGQPAGIVTDEIATDDLVLSFHTIPDTVRAGGQVVAELTISNPTSDTISLETDGGCLGRVSVLEWDGEPSRFYPASDSCVDTATTVIIEPGESLVRRWTVTAWLRGIAPDHDTIPPWPGLYSVRLTTPPPLPDLDAPFTVWPSGYWLAWRRCGFAVPTASDSIIVSVDTETVFYGLVSKPYEIYNFTSSEVWLTEGGFGTMRINGRRLSEGWFNIQRVVEQYTATGWEPYSTSRRSITLDVLLRPNECIQVRNPLDRVPAGTYRVVVFHRDGRAYSEPVVVH